LKRDTEKVPHVPDEFPQSLLELPIDFIPPKKQQARKKKKKRVLRIPKPGVHESFQLGGIDLLDTPITAGELLDLDDVGKSPARYPDTPHDSTEEEGVVIDEGLLEEGLEMRYPELYEEDDDHEEGPDEDVDHSLLDILKDPELIRALERIQDLSNPRQANKELKDLFS